jgi:hypothetical protein
MPAVALEHSQVAMRLYLLFLAGSLLVAAVGGAIAYMDRPQLVTCIAGKILSGESGKSCTDLRS